MNETILISPGSNRLLRSARVLKAYFEHKLNLSLELLSEAPSQPLNYGMQFSLPLGHWGVWGLRASAPLDEKTQAEISSTFHGLLNSMDELECRRQDLERLEMKYRETLEDLPANVVPLRKPRPEPQACLKPRPLWRLRLDCILECANPEDIHKMALEMHGKSQRVGFLNYNDLAKEMRQNASELQALGAVTMLIPDIMHLAPVEQQTLHQLTRINSLERPLLIVGASLPFAGLRSDAAINLDLLLTLARAYFKLTRPFAEYKRDNLIHYFLDSLAQSPT